MERAQGGARGRSAPGSLLVGRGRRAPLVSIHTYVDELDHDRAIAAALDDRPVLAILPPGPDEGPIPDRMEQWVDRSVRAIRSAGLEGPHHLIGWSLGGIIAWEVARRLRVEGETVAYAANIDAMRAKLRPRRVGEAVRYHLDEARRIDDRRRRGAYLLRAPARHLDGVRERSVKRVLRARRRLGLGTDEPIANTAEAYPPLVYAAKMTGLHFMPKPYFFRPTLFVSRVTASIVDSDELLRWGTFLPAGVDVHQVPGDHHSMWDAAHVVATAEAIARSLRSVDEQEVVPHGGDAQAG
jgi:thioesterase domain-containing protein